MISIIICSRQKSISPTLAKNINKTVGVDYELIVIDNSNNQYSIFEAYNQGISKSKGDLLCFLHDDILFHTLDWGQILERLFKERPKVGLIGIAGSKVKTKMPSPWWNTSPEFSVINIIQHWDTTKISKTSTGFDNQNEVEVAAIDGVFMVLKKSTGIYFCTNIKGFHNYDLNLSIENYIKGFKVLVTNRIYIEHFSRGSMNKDWYISTMKFHDYYKKYLPIKTEEEINPKAIAALEVVNGSKFINQLLENGLKKEAFKYWIKLIWLKPYSKFHFNILKNFF